MARKAKARQPEYRVPSQQLHSILAELVVAAQDGHTNQRDALVRVLRAPADMGSYFFERLAHLHRLPELTQQALTRTGADPIYFEWVDPVQEAMSTLDGSANSPLHAFRNNDALSAAIVKLYMCTPVLANEDALEIQQLSDIREAIGDVLAEIEKAPGLDNDLENWLVSILRSAREVTHIAETLGAYAAREKIRTIIGGALADPAPPPTSEEGGELTQRAIDLFTRLAAAVLGKATTEVAQLVAGNVVGFLTGSTE